MASEIIKYLKNETEHSNLLFIMDNAFCRLLSKDFEPDNMPVHFRSSGVLLLNLAGLKYNV